MGRGMDGLNDNSDQGRANDVVGYTPDFDISPTCYNPERLDSNHNLTVSVALMLIKRQ